MRAIKNILVPVDFSENAKAAFEFAVGLAEDLNAKIKVLHILNDFKSPSPLADALIVPVSNEDYEQKLQDFLKEEEDELGNVLIKRKVKVSSETVFGSVAPTLLSYSDSGNYDLIVMGITGEKSMGEVFFGSTASEVSQQAKCPVLLVPRNYNYTGIKDILYACDIDHTSNKHIKTVADVADFFEADVNMVFVRSAEEKERNFDKEINQIAKLFNEYAPDLLFEGEVVNEESVVEGVNTYCKENSIDMVVIVTKHRKFWERILHVSITKQVAIYAEEPIFIIHEN